MTRALAAAAAAAIAAVGALALPAAAGAQVLQARDATIRDIEPPIEQRTFEVTEADGSVASSRWREVRGLGNCCETYLATDARGRLFDFGGNYINLSDDRGQTWAQVRPPENFIGGEGAIVVGLGGDVFGVGWDPYTGDVLLSFRYEAATGKWRTARMPLHSPFYDREWIGVVPGPITIEGDTFPWVTFVKGGYPSKEAWLYSTDGLIYTEMSSKALGSTVNGVATGPLPIAPSPELDVIQANGGMGLTPLGAGRALAEPDAAFDPDYSVLEPADVQWRSFSFADGIAGQFHSDSRGWLHNVVADDVPETGETGGAFEYRLSADGGATFRSVTVPLPPGVTLRQLDFRVSGALGLAAVAIRGRTADGPSRDLLYKLDVRAEQPALLRSYAIGLGDLVTGSSVTSTDPRFDFESLALLPDGRVAVSFMDSETGRQPAIAIELDAPVPASFATSEPPPPGPLAGPPTPAVLSQPAVDVTGPRGGAHRVKLRVRRRGGRATASGTVLPRHPGHVVRIQRRAGRRWATVATIRAGRRSTFSRTLRLPRRAVLRAVAAADGAGHRAGRSRPLRLR